MAEALSHLPKMTYRFLGRSGLQVSTISLGGWLTYGGHVDRGEAFKSVLRSQLFNKDAELSEITKNALMPV